MRILLFLTLLLLLSISLSAKEKVYYDTSKNHEIIDISGQKSVVEINNKFGGNYLDITADREQALELSNQDAEKKAKEEMEIQKVIRQMALERIKATH